MATSYPTQTTYTIPRTRRASLQQTTGSADAARPRQENTNARRTFTTTNRGYTSSTRPTDINEDNLPNTNPPIQNLNIGGKIKRLTGRLNPYLYRPQTTGTKLQKKNEVDGFSHSRKTLLIGIVIGIVLLVACYTLIFLTALAWIASSNAFQYGGSIHTSYSHVVLQGEPSTIITSNDSGTIYVTIIQRQKDGSLRSTIYTGPKLNPNAWGNDLNSIIGTANTNTAQGNQDIIITLTGNINYLRPFLVRPQLQFTLHPTSQGAYSVIVQP